METSCCCSKRLGSRQTTYSDCTVPTILIPKNVPTHWKSWTQELSDEVRSLDAGGVPDVLIPRSEDSFNYVTGAQFARFHWIYWIYWFHLVPLFNQIKLIYQVDIYIYFNQLSIGSFNHMWSISQWTDVILQRSPWLFPFAPGNLR